MKYSEFLETRWIAFGISLYDVEAAFNAILPPASLDSLNFKRRETVERKLVSRVNEKRVVLFVAITLLQNILKKKNIGSLYKVNELTIFFSIFPFSWKFSKEYIKYTWF